MTERPEADQRTFALPSEFADSQSVSSAESGRQAGYDKPKTCEFGAEVRR